MFPGNLALINSRSQGLQFCNKSLPSAEFSQRQGLKQDKAEEPAVTTETQNDADTHRLSDSVQRFFNRLSMCCPLTMSDDLMFPQNTSVKQSNSTDLVMIDNVTRYHADINQFPEQKIAKWLNYYIPWTALLVAVLGNGASLITVLKMKPFSSLSLFLAYLAVTDTLCVATSFAFTQLSFNRVNLGIWGCKVILFLMNYVIFLANWTVVLMTIERFTAVCFPFRVPRIFNLRNSVMYLTVKAFVFMIPTSVAFWIFTEETDPISNRAYCAEIPEMEHVSKVVGWFDLVLYAILPCLLLLGLNGGIIRTLNKSDRVRNEATNADLLKTSSNSYGKQRAQVPHRHLSIMLVTVSVAFVILQLPITLFYIVSRYQTAPSGLRDQAINNLIAEIVHSLNEFNHAFNFIFYFISGKKFRRKFLELTKCNLLLNLCCSCPVKTNDSSISESLRSSDAKLSRLNARGTSVDSRSAESICCQDNI